MGAVIVTANESLCHGEKPRCGARVSRQFHFYAITSVAASAIFYCLTTRFISTKLLQNQQIFDF
jgi:hypothetical protein